jgi:hypothetical protein
MAVMVVLLLAVTFVLVPGELRAQADPYSLSFQAFVGTTQTNISIAISASSGFSLPTVADRIMVKALNPNGSVGMTVQYTDVALLSGLAVVAFPPVAANTPLLVQVNFKTGDNSRSHVLRADSIVVSNVDVSIDNVSAPALINEHTSFSVTVAVKELSGNAGATFDLRIVVQSPGTPDGLVQNPGGVVGSLTGQLLGPGGSATLVVPCEISVAQTALTATYVATALLVNVTPNDSVPANNSLAFNIDINCSPNDADCGD